MCVKITNNKKTISVTIVSNCSLIEHSNIIILSQINFYLLSQINAYVSVIYVIKTNLLNDRLIASMLSDREQLNFVINFYLDKFWPSNVLDVNYKGNIFILVHHHKQMLKALPIIIFKIQHTSPRPRPNTSLRLIRGNAELVMMMITIQISVFGKPLP